MGGKRNEPGVRRHRECARLDCSTIGIRPKKDCVERSPLRWWQDRTDLVGDAPRRAVNDANDRSTSDSVGRLARTR